MFDRQSPQAGQPRIPSDPRWIPSAGPAGLRPSTTPDSPPPTTWQRWIAAAALVVVAAVATVLVVLTGQGNPNTARPDARTVAAMFADLEARRYNASNPPPHATRATYAAVSCEADLAQMSVIGPPLPPLPTHPRYTFAVTSIKATQDGRDLLTITETDTASGNTGDGLFYLQQQQQGWRVCGLYKNTEPSPQATNGTSIAGGASTNTRSGASVSTAVQQFLSTVGASVAAGDFGTALEAVCTQDPAATAADAPVESWAQGHARIQVDLPIDTSGGPAIASARIHVSQSGHAPVTYGLVLQQDAGRWCIDQIQQES